MKFLYALVFALVPYVGMANEPSGPVLAGSVTCVIDGATFKVQLHSGLVTMRLDGIDGSESNKRHDKEATGVLAQVDAVEHVQLVRCIQSRNPAHGDEPMRW